MAKASFVCRHPTAVDQPIENPAVVRCDIVPNSSCKLIRGQVPKKVSIGIPIRGNFVGEPVEAGVWNIGVQVEAVNELGDIGQFRGGNSGEAWDEGGGEGGQNCRTNRDIRASGVGGKGGEQIGKGLRPRPAIEPEGGELSGAN